MKLVFVTQVIDADNAVLGFVVRWVQGLAKYCDAVRVIALEAGDVSTLPANVDVREIGRRGTVRRFLRYRSYLSEAFGKDGFDTLLTHMVPRYSNVAASIAKKHQIPHFLWYTTKGVDARLHRAVKIVDKVFTASPESLRVETDKKVVTGHGIDLTHFDARDENPAFPMRLLAVGRLTQAKDPLTLLAAFSILIARGHDLYLDLVGGALAPGDPAYARTVAEQIELGGLQDRVHLHGPVSYREIPSFYRRCTLYVSTSLTGSVDKVVLEAMATGRPVLTCNESFGPIFEELGADAANLAFKKGDAQDLAERMEAILLRAPLDRMLLGNRLRKLVERDHEVDNLMQRLVSEMGHRA